MSGVAPSSIPVTQKFSRRALTYLRENSATLGLKPVTTALLRAIHNNRTRGVTQGTLVVTYVR